MAWEKFKRVRGGTYYPLPAFVSITRHGVIGFSVNCVTDFNIDQFKYGVLYFDLDADVKRIGVVFTNNEKEVGIRRLRSRTSYRRSGLQLSGMGLLNYYGVMPEITTRYKPEHEGTMLVIPLDRINQE